MDRQKNTFWTLPETAPAKALAPVRRLVLAAYIGAFLAGGMLVYSTIHVMWTTDALSMQEERVRASYIADLLAEMSPGQVQPNLVDLGSMAGLTGLVMTASAATEPYHQSIPLLAGPMGGQFLTWQADRPGLYLFTSFAPMRVPLMLVLVGSVLACLLVMQQKMRRIENERLLAQRQALRDHLTGLPNRLALERELVRLAEGRQDFSVVALDLDRFKPVNDLFGHHAGDLALIEVAQRLSAQLRPGEFLARIGGDEFVAIAQRGHRAALTQLARDCIAAVGQPLHVVGHNVTVGISLGIIEDGRDHPAGALLKQADRALYDAKRLDGGAFCFSGNSVSRPQRPRHDPDPILLASG